MLCAATPLTDEKSPPMNTCCLSTAIANTMGPATVEPPATPGPMPCHAEPSHREMPRVSAGPVWSNDPPTYSLPPPWATASANPRPFSPVVTPWPRVDHVVPFSTPMSSTSSALWIGPPVSNAPPTYTPPAGLSAMAFTVDGSCAIGSTVQAGDPRSNDANPPFVAVGPGMT